MSVLILYEGVTLIHVIVFSIHTFIRVCCNYVYINGISYAIEL